MNQYDQVVHAAVPAQGIALSQGALVEPMLADGRLIELEWDARATTCTGLLQADSEPRDDVRTVAEWILRPARDTKSRLADSRHMRPAHVSVEENSFEHRVAVRSNSVVSHSRARMP